jgi:hypothetical protein
MTLRHWHLTGGRHADGGPGRPDGQGSAGSPARPTGAGGSAGRRLGVIGLALVLIAAMDSIRNLPTTATFGWSCAADRPAQGRTRSTKGCGRRRSSPGPKRNWRPAACPAARPRSGRCWR